MSSLISFGFARSDQSQKYLLTFMEVEVFVCRNLDTNDAVKFGIEDFLHHNGRVIDLMFIKIYLSFILVVLLLVGVTEEWASRSPSHTCNRTHVAGLSSVHGT